MAVQGRLTQGKEYLRTLADELHVHTYKLTVSAVDSDTVHLSPYDRGSFFNFVMLSLSVSMSSKNVVSVCPCQLIFVRMCLSVPLSFETLYHAELHAVCVCWCLSLWLYFTLFFVFVSSTV